MKKLIMAVIWRSGSDLK